MPVGTTGGARDRRTISSIGIECLPAGLSASTNNIGSPASGTWGTANRAVYIPLTLRRPFTVAKVAVYNGATATGNVDVGIYSEDGVKLWSAGSTAQSGTNAFQVFTPGTPVKLAPGRYYLAMACSSGSATILGRLFADHIGRVTGVGIEASAFPLPATATIAAAPSALRYPNIVISEGATI